MRTDPVLAAPGTHQSSESFIWVEVRPLRRACHLKVILSSHLQRITSLHVHGDRHIYVFFLLFSFLSVAISCYLFCSYIPLYITLSYFQLWSLCDRRLSYLRIPWDCLLSLVFDQDANFPFLLVCFFLLATLCSMQVLSSSMGMKPVWTLYSLRGKGRILITGPSEKSLIQINVSRHVTPAHTPYNPIIALPSRLVYI